MEKVELQRKFLIRQILKKVFIFLFASDNFEMLEISHNYPTICKMHQLQIREV